MIRFVEPVLQSRRGFAPIRLLGRASRSLSEQSLPENKVLCPKTTSDLSVAVLASPLSRTRRNTKTGFRCVPTTRRHPAVRILNRCPSSSSASSSAFFFGGSGFFAGFFFGSSFVALSFASSASRFAPAFSGGSSPAGSFAAGSSAGGSSMADFLAAGSFSTGVFRLRFGELRAGGDGENSILDRREFVFRRPQLEGVQLTVDGRLYDRSSQNDHLEFLLRLSDATIGNTVKGTNLHRSDPFRRLTRFLQSVADLRGELTHVLPGDGLSSGGLFSGGRS